MVRQPPVDTASSLSRESLHLLGFAWFAARPDAVSIECAVLSAGRFTTSFISEVSFDADGRTVASVNAESEQTDAAQSLRISMEDFVRIARAKKVLMKVTRFGTHTISVFGTEVPGAAINQRFTPFLAAIQEIQSGGKADRPSLMTPGLR